MTVYRAVQDGVEVFTTTTDAYEGLAPFPAELLDRPTTGVVELIVDDEIIAVNVPLEEG